MQDSNVMKALIRDVERVARQYGGPKVLLVRVQIGPECLLSEEDLRERFVEESRGTVAEHANLIIERESSLPEAPAHKLRFDEVILHSVMIEDILPMTVRAAMVSPTRGIRSFP